MNDFRYQLERYRGRGSRYVCPQCGRKYVFTRYVDTHSNNEYVNDKVGKCNRLDKCGYHYTPHQYFEDNPWLRDKEFSSSFSFHRKKEETKKETPQLPPQPKPYGLIPRWVMERKDTEDSSGGGLRLPHIELHGGWHVWPRCRHRRCCKRAGVLPFLGEKRKVRRLRRFV